MLLAGLLSMLSLCCLDCLGPICSSRVDSAVVLGTAPPECIVNGFPLFYSPCRSSRQPLFFLWQYYYAILLEAESLVGVANCWAELMTEQTTLGMFGFNDPAVHADLVHACTEPSPNQRYTDHMVSRHMMHSTCIFWTDTLSGFLVLYNTNIPCSAALLRQT